MWYVTWLTLLFFYYLVYAYFSKNFNLDRSWKNFWMLYSMNFIAIWPLVAAYSKNLIFDGLLFDIMLFLSFNVSLIYWGCADKFSVGQWIGVGLVFVGFVVMKVFE